MDQVAIVFIVILVLVLIGFIYALIKVGSKIVKGSIVAFRVAMVISAIWFVALMAVNPIVEYRNDFIGGGQGYYDLNDSFFYLNLPLIIFWGVIWILKGRQ